MAGQGDKRDWARFDGRFQSPGPGELGPRSFLPRRRRRETGLPTRVSRGKRLFGPAMIDHEPREPCRRVTGGCRVARRTEVRQLSHDLRSIGFGRKLLHQRSPQADVLGQLAQRRGGARQLVHFAGRGQPAAHSSIFLRSPARCEAGALRHSSPRSGATMAAGCTRIDSPTETSVLARRLVVDESAGRDPRRRQSRPTARVPGPSTGETRIVAPGRRSSGSMRAASFAAVGKVVA